MSNAGPDKTRKPLGRGLSSLLPPRPASTTPAKPADSDGSPGIVTVGIDAISPNPNQPRTAFRPDRLNELAASIRANGIIQPLIVRQVESGYQIIAGERRWRAAKLAELSEVPVIIQDISDPRKLLEIALIENVQREDLNPIETAVAYDRLSREFGLSQEEIGRRTGKERSSIANIMRLLRLPQEVQVLVADGRLSVGQAKAILGLDDPADQVRLAEKAAAQGLNARQVEALVQQETMREVNARKSKKEEKLDPNVEAALEELRRVLQTKVKIVELSDQRGKIEIQYYSQDDLQRIYDQIIGGAR